MLPWLFPFGSYMVSKRAMGPGQVGADREAGPQAGTYRDNMV